MREQCLASNHLCTQDLVVLEHTQIQYVGGGVGGAEFCFVSIAKNNVVFYQCADKLMLLANLRFDPRSQGLRKKKTMLLTSNAGCHWGFIGSDLYRLRGLHYIYCQKPIMWITCIYERHFEVPFMPVHPAPKGDVPTEMKTTFVGLCRGCTYTHLCTQARMCTLTHTKIHKKQTWKRTYFMFFFFRKEVGRMLVIRHYSRLFCWHSSLSLPTETAANSQNCSAWKPHQQSASSASCLSRCIR